MSDNLSKIAKMFYMEANECSLQSNSVNFLTRNIVIKGFWFKVFEVLNENN